MKAGDATSLIILAGGAVAVYFLYKSLNKAGQTASDLVCSIAHPNCALTNELQAACGWLQNELGLNSCGQ